MYPMIEFFGRKIPTYGLCLIFAFTIVILLGYFRARKKYKPIAIEDMITIGAIVLGFALTGGYLLYIFVTYPVIQLILSGDFSFIFNGGIVFYGGLLGGIIGAFVGLKIFKIAPENLEVSVVPFIPLGHALGRVGCALAGCCYGM